MTFRVDLEIFRGPLDLLLYLVRKHEVEVTDIPVAPIVEQFLQYLAILQELDVDAAGDFLDMASTLVEIKSRMVLPRSEEIEDQIDDPRQELVRQLLEYKKFKHAASMLEEQGRDWQHRYPRLGNDLPRRLDPSEEPIHEVELWDLVSAFGRIMRDTAAARPSSIVYDDTPIHVYMSRIHAQIRERGQVPFSELFARDVHRSVSISVFLAVLELVRHHGVRAEQNETFGEIWVLPSLTPEQTAEFGQVDTYEHARRPK